MLYSMIPFMHGLSARLLFAKSRIKFFQPVRIDKRSGHVKRKYIASQLMEALEKLEELSSNPKDLQIYVTDRQRIAQTIHKACTPPRPVIKSLTHASKLQSVDPTKQWLYTIAQQKEHLSEELMGNRRTRSL